MSNFNDLPEDVRREMVKLMAESNPGEKVTARCSDCGEVTVELNKQNYYECPVCKRKLDLIMVMVK